MLPCNAALNFYLKKKEFVISANVLLVKEIVLVEVLYEEKGSNFRDNFVIYDNVLLRPLFRMR